ncbi:MAG: hypothetical protein E6J91_21490 [Deltaproteobacteria bacterium]|nr:MAG: hypothetical protein E6J91_21490 [Deltaproteobacteria bacterium]
MSAPQYTKCVDRYDYEYPNFGPEIFVAIAGLVYAISTFGISLVLSLAAAMSALMKVCDYILNGKLVCLGDDQCAVGRVAAFETVDDKSGVDKIDNDFSINLLLAPHHLDEFANGTQEANYKWLIKDTTSWGHDGLPGKLITEQSDMPLPRESDGGSWHSARYAGTFKTYANSNYISWEDPPTPGKPFDVPVFHCEIEGERAHAVCSTLAALSSPIPGFGAICRFKLFGIPLGRWACAVVAAILAPIILAALAIAWAAGSDDNRSFDGAGSLKRGDPVIIRGRWCYDASHSGWNEIHPVMSVQRIENEKDLDGVMFKDAIARWCSLTGEVPPVTDPGVRPQGMTPEQSTVYDNQQQPENQWVIHPYVDGCEPVETAPPPPVIH